MWHAAERLHLCRAKATTNTKCPACRRRGGLRLLSVVRGSLRGDAAVGDATLALGSGPPQPFCAGPRCPRPRPTPGAASPQGREAPQAAQRRGQPAQGRGVGWARMGLSGCAASAPSPRCDRAPHPQPLGVCHLHHRAGSLLSGITGGCLGLFGLRDLSRQTKHT